MKRRKRTNKDVPAVGVLRDMADRLWSKAVRADGNHRCAICGRSGKLDAHHLIPRHHTATRYSLENGLCLCGTCHKFCPHRAPHMFGEGFRNWMKEHLPLRHGWLLQMTESGDFRNFNGTKDWRYYCDVISSFREYFEPEEFERIVGVKFNRYLEEQK